MDHQKDLGNLVRPWGMAGFSGFSVGQIQMGQREHELVVRLSGECAWHNWRRVYEFCDNVTRLDWQITFRPAVKPRQFIRKCRREALRWTNARKGAVGVRLITSSDGSDTLYLGARQSDVMARLYNKGLQSKQKRFDGYVRAEVEYKGKQAKLVSRDLARSKSEFGPGFNKVCSFFSRRGVELGLIHDL